MGYDRYPRGNPGYRPDRDRDYGSDYGADRGRHYGARDDRGAGYGRDDDDARSYRSRYAPERDNERGDSQRFRDEDRDMRPYRGSSMDYGRWEPGSGRNRGLDDDHRQRHYRRDHGRSFDRSGQDHGRRPEGYDYDGRGFFDRAGDEVRSWFGDDDAERRREMDRRNDERYANVRDDHYDSWRREQISSLDRDYDEYRRENATKFRNEFTAFRTERQGQRECLNRVQEHMEVVGSDGAHVGTVDKVRGDRIVLTKSDKDAGGHHHSIPSRWIDSVDDKVKIRKSADEAKREWRDEERNQAMFRNEQPGVDSRARDDNAADQSRAAAQPGTGAAFMGGTQDDREGGADTGNRDGQTDLNRSFKGTY